MYSPQPTYASNHKRQKISTFGLQRVSCFHQGPRGLSSLRVSSVLGKQRYSILPCLCAWNSDTMKWAITDTWTPFEIRVFEVAIECYGKDFPRIADVVSERKIEHVRSER